MFSSANFNNTLGSMRITINCTAVAQTFAKFSENASLQESAQLFAQGLPVAEMIQALAMNEQVLRAFAGCRDLLAEHDRQRHA